MTDEDMEILLETLLECGSDDLEMLGDILLVANNFNITLRDVMNNIDAGVDLDALLYSAFELVFNRIMELAEESLKNLDVENEDDEFNYVFLVHKLKKIKEEFNPDIDYVDSCFNNYLDEVYQDLDSYPNYPDEKYIKLITDWQ